MSKTRSVEMKAITIRLSDEEWKEMGTAIKAMSDEIGVKISKNAFLVSCVRKCLTGTKVEDTAC